MLERRHAAVALGLALLGLAGFALVASGQVGSTSTQEYETRLKALDHNQADAIYALAKWCYTKKMNGEARALAIETLQKAPEDVRAKYLLYVLAGAPTTSSGTTDQTEPETSMSDEEVAAVFAREKEPLSTGFLPIQRILINSCGAAACHGGQNTASKWVLVNRDLASKKTLATNFVTISKYINRENKAASLLLKKPSLGKEAGHPLIVFKGPTDQVYAKVSLWLNSVVGGMWDERTMPSPAPGK